MALTLNWKQIQSCLGELAASFIFGFAVYASIISANLTESDCASVAVALAVGLSGVAVIYSFCDVALAHFNPAITLSAILLGKLSILKGLLYIIAQILGFFIAAAVVLGCFPEKSSELLNIIRPKKASDDVSIGNLLCTEMFLTGILTFVAFQVAINAFKKSKDVRSSTESQLPTGTAEYTDPEASKPDKSIFAPLVIGFTLGFLALLGGASSGGAFNPGIVLAPVLFSGKWKDAWAYWLAEFVGSFVGAAIQVFILARRY